MSSGGLFSFNPAAGETPETLKRRRQVAEAMLASAVGSPATTIGGGLAAIGQAIGGRLALGRVNRAEAAGQAGAADVFSKLFGGGGAAAPAAPAPGDVLAGGGGTDTLSGAGGGIPDVAAQEAYIRASAPKYGVDPDIAVKVARSEGLAPGVWQSNVMGKGGRETSYGPYQLLVGGGLGDEFQRTTGLNAADPSSWQKQIDFALGQAAKQGWSPWMGAAKVGVGPRTGIGGTPAVTAALTGTEPVASADPGAMAAAGMGGGPDWSQFATGGGVDFSGVSPEMSSSAGALLAAMPPELRKQTKIRSAYRPYDKQYDIYYRQKIRPAATPGRSLHEYGSAFDIDFGSPEAKRWLYANAGRYGLEFPLPGNDPGHLQLRSAKNLTRNEAASRAYQASLGGRPPDFRGGAGRNAPVVASPVEGGGVPAVMEALTGKQEAVSDTSGGLRNIGAAVGPDVMADLGYIDPAAKDDLLPAEPAFRPAGGPTPYSAGNTVLGGGSANAGRLTPVPDPTARPAIAPVVAAEATPVAATAPAAPGVAPVAQALGYDPLPQTSAMPGVGGVQGAGHESLSPGAQAVSQALAGGGGTDTLAGGGGKGFFGRIFGGRTGTPPAVAGGGGAVPPTAATGVPGAGGSAGTEGAPGAGTEGFSPRAQAAIAALQNPWLNEGQQAVAKTILDNEIAQADPKYRVELEAARESLRQAQTPTRQLTKEELAERGLDPNSKISIDAKGNLSEVPQPKPITIDNRLIDPTTHEVLYEPPPGTRILTRAEAIDNRLDPDLGTWTLNRDGKPDLVEGTERPGLINVGGGTLYDPIKKEWITAPTAGKQEVKLTDEKALRQELADSLGVSRYRFSQPILSSMVSSLYDNSTASDFQYIYGVAQIFDPNSVVRTEEGKQVIDSQSIPEAIKGRLEQMLNMNSAIGVTARRDLIATGARRIAEYNKQATTESTFFGKIAERKGIDPENIVFPLETLPEAPVAPPEGAVQELVANATKETMAQFDEAFGEGAAKAYLTEAGLLEPE